MDCSHGQTKTRKLLQSQRSRLLRDSKASRLIRDRDGPSYRPPLGEMNITTPFQTLLATGASAAVPRISTAQFLDASENRAVRELWIFDFRAPSPQGGSHAAILRDMDADPDEALGTDQGRCGLPDHRRADFSRHRYRQADARHGLRTAYEHLQEV